MMKSEKSEEQKNRVGSTDSGGSQCREIALEILSGYSFVIDLAENGAVAVENLLVEVHK